jgi:hypothetical protein
MLPHQKDHAPPLRSGASSHRADRPPAIRTPFSVWPATEPLPDVVEEQPEVQHQRVGAPTGRARGTALSPFPRDSTSSSSTSSARNVCSSTV